MEQVLEHINRTADRAVSELNKNPIKHWNAQNIHLIKHVIDKIKLCFDEFHFHLQQINLKDEAQLLQKLCTSYSSVFEKIEEVNQRKVMNPPELPIEYCCKIANGINQKTIFGGTEVQPFSIYAQTKSKFLNAEQEFKAVRQKQLKNMQSKGTDTNEDAMALISKGYLDEKEKEIQMMEEENAQNLMELEKHLKLKGLWSEMHASHAQLKIHDVFRQMEKETYRNELFVNDQLRVQNEQQDEDNRNIKGELKDNIVLIQKKTADRVIKACEKKMKHEYERFVLKKTAGILMRKSKQSNFQRLEELEKVILNKNQEIFDKEQKILQLVQRFEQQEKKLGDLLNQVDEYKENEHHFKSHLHSENCMDIEIQVNIPDRRIYQMELQLSEIAQENETMKNQMKEMHQEALKAKNSTITEPKQIEEVLYMILNSDLTPEKKIEALSTLLQYITDNSEADMAHMAPNEIFKTIKQKVMPSQRVLQDESESGGEDDLASQPSITKKQKRKKNKQKTKKFASEKPSETFIDSSTQQMESKITIKKSQREEESFQEDVDSNQSEMNLFLKKKQNKGLHKISEESQHFKNSPRSREVQKSGRSSKRSGRQNQSHSNSNHLRVEQPAQTQQVIRSQRNINYPKDPSHFKTEKTEQRVATSSSRIQQNNSRQGMSRQDITSQQQIDITQKGQISIRDLDQEKGKDQSKQVSKQISPQNSIRSNRKIMISRDFEEVESEQINERLWNKGIQSYNRMESQTKIRINQEKQQQQQQQSNAVSRAQSQFYNSPQQTAASTTKEKITTKQTQTDDFFLFNLFQKMAGDLGMSEDQMRRLEQIFLNEQQFIHFYDRDQSMQYQLSQHSQLTTIPIQQSTLPNKGLQRTSSLVMDKDGRFIELQRSESVKMGKNETQETDGKRVSLAKTRASPLLKNQLLSYTNDSSLQINQNRSASQNSEVHIMNYGPVSPDNKNRRVSQSQRILEEMLKNKSSVNVTPTPQQEREQKLYYNIFGDEIQNDNEFEMEAVRMNLGRPLEIMQDHLKEEAIKRIFTQLVSRPKNAWQEQIYLVISQYANKPISAITYIDFKKYYENYMRVHKKCGDGCIHIQRFLARIGFGVNPKRKVLNMNKSSVTPFGQLPKLK